MDIPATGAALSRRHLSEVTKHISRLENERQKHIHESAMAVRNE